jgi:hypothetical protein
MTAGVDGGKQGKAVPKPMAFPPVAAVQLAGDPPRGAGISHQHGENGIVKEGILHGGSFLPVGAFLNLIIPHIGGFVMGKDEKKKKRMAFCGKIAHPPC